MRRAKLGLASIEREVERIRTLLGAPLGVAVYNSGAISVPTATWTVLTFDTERQDDADFHSTVSNTSRLTVPTGKGGWYSIAGAITFAASAAGTGRVISLYLNGTTYIAWQRAPFSGALATHIAIATCYPLSASDYIELAVWQDTGGALNVNATGNYSPEFRMVRMRGV